MSFPSCLLMVWEAPVEKKLQVSAGDMCGRVTFPHQDTATILLPLTHFPLLPLSKVNLSPKHREPLQTMPP